MGLFSLMNKFVCPLHCLCARLTKIKQSKHHAKEMWENKGPIRRNKVVKFKKEKKKKNCF